MALHHTQKLGKYLLYEYFMEVTHDIKFVSCQRISILICILRYDLHIPIGIEQQPQDGCRHGCRQLSPIKNTCKRQNVQLPLFISDHGEGNVMPSFNEIAQKYFNFILFSRHESVIS